MRAIGTSRLVLGSLQVFGTPAVVQESEQFVLPFLSAHPVPDPQREATFTLNQFNMAVALDDQGRDLSHLHFYTFDQTFLLALPTLLQRERLAGVRRELLRHLSVALGYVPSWLSRTFSLVAEPPAAQNELPALRLTPSGEQTPRRNRFMQKVLRHLVPAGSMLDCWPAVPALTFAAHGKSYHFGGTFPHHKRATGRFTSDSLGRVAPWTRIHLIDASVFPSIAATTFTLTIMANAHRITSELVTGRSW